jgi:SulP family sulfate permease
MALLWESRVVFVVGKIKFSFFFNLIESIKHLGNTSLITLGIFIAFLIGLLLFKRFTPKIPGAILLAPLGIGLGYLSTIQVIPISLQTLGSKFGDISFHFFGTLNFGFSIFMIETAAVIALIAILETMLSAKIADGMTHTKYNERKEMLGLGLANIVSGLVGGMPATAALARTSLNIKTGGTHRTSAIISVISVSIISLFFLGYFKYIPLAVIAAILVFVAIQMVETAHYKKLFHYERAGFYVSIFVALITIVIDPIIGILLGVTISLLIFVNRISKGHFDQKINEFDEDTEGTDSSSKLKEIKETNLVKYKSIILRLREVHFMDTDGIEALDEIIDIIESRGQQVILTGIDQNVLDLLEQLSHGYKKLKEKGLVFEKAGQALLFLGIPLKEKNTNPS